MKTLVLNEIGEIEKMKDQRMEEWGKWEMMEDDIMKGRLEEDTEKIYSLHTSSSIL